MPDHDSTCKNCGHWLYISGQTVEHFTRHYHSFGYPYTSVRCYADGCFCIKPEMEVLLC